MPIKLEGNGFWPAVIKHVVLNGDEVKKVFLNGVEVFPSFAPAETFTVYLVCEAKITGHVKPLYDEEYYELGYRWYIYHTSSVTRKFNGISIDPGETRVLVDYGYTDYTKFLKVKSPFTKTIDVTAVVWRKPDKYGDPDEGYDVLAIPQSQWTINCLIDPIPSYAQQAVCVYEGHTPGDDDKFTVYYKLEIVNIRTHGTFGQTGSYCIYDRKMTVSHTADMDLQFSGGVYASNYIVHEGQTVEKTDKDLYWFWGPDQPSTRDTYEFGCFVPHKNDTGITTYTKIVDAIPYGMTDPNPHAIYDDSKVIYYIT